MTGGLFSDDQNGLLRDKVELNAMLPVDLMPRMLQDVCGETSWIYGESGDNSLGRFTWDWEADGTLSATRTGVC